MHDYVHTAFTNTHQVLSHPKNCNTGEKERNPVHNLIIPPKFRNKTMRKKFQLLRGEGACASHSTMPMHVAPTHRNQDAAR